MSSADFSDHLGDIAIVGIAGRFPGARSLAEFWRNLRDGVESITVYSEEELLAAGVSPETLADPHYIRAGASLPDIEMFDAPFFGFTPREAEITDPQHRLFLECAWEALEDAGYNAGACKERIGVYAGASTTTYILNIFSDPRLAASAGALQIEIGNDKDHLATRVSYKLNLRGPAVTVQTGCSTSLVAVHIACQSLLDHECDMALAGGVSVSSYRPSGYLYHEGGVRSPDGHCRAFDSEAGGTLAGSGVGIVVLKRMADALAGGDYIHAVIKASAVNNDGASKIGYTAPSVDGQAEVIAKALALAGISPGEITYVEAHGTATPLGDPIEIAALTKSFRAGTDKKGFCAIGSVKTNVGHLNVAAGVTGLIKTALSLKYRMIPPSLHFEQPNPNIDFAGSPFYVNASLTPWRTDGAPRIAGVSSFSIGGTNAHVIIEEAPAPTPGDVRRDWHLLPLSARTAPALEAATARLATHLRQNPETNPADLAYTLQVGRKKFGQRRVLVCCDVADAAAALEASEGERVMSSFEDEEAERSVTFMFTGQGAQHVNMAHELYRGEPTFRAEVDRCAELLAPTLGLDLRHVLYAPAGHDARAGEQLKETCFAQPALFVTEYALAKLWMAWGVRPSAMIGHSLGEFVAACLSGVFSLPNALSLVAARGRLMQQLPEGAMLAVPLAEAEITPLLAPGLSLAAVNGPKSCVVSGTAEELAGLERRLSEQGLPFRRLAASRAFHSEVMERIAGEFAREVEQVRRRPPEIPYVSNVTGTWIKAGEATDPSYWGRHLRETVRFSAGLVELLKEPRRILLEVGPGQTLCALARQHIGKNSAHLALPSLCSPREPVHDVASLLGALGRLWLAGAFDNWEEFYAGERRRRIPLPTYPFERERFWVEHKTTPSGDNRHGRLERKSDATDWLYVPLWQQSIPVRYESDVQAGGRRSSWLVFVDECGIGAQVVEQLKQSGEAVVAVSDGEQFARREDDRYIVNAGRAGDYRRLCEELSTQGGMPARIVHLWSVGRPVDNHSAIESYEASLRRGYHSLLFLAQSLGDQLTTDPVSIFVVSNNVHNVVGDDALHPEQAALLGACKVIPKEYPSTTCRSIDFDLPALHAEGYAKTATRLIAELRAETSDASVALRGGHRWVQTFESLKGGNVAAPLRHIRAGGTYLLTGIWSGIGFAVAEYLAKEFKAKLIILDNATFPPRDEWARMIKTHSEAEPLTWKMQALLSLEESGAETHLFTADLTNVRELREVVEQAHRRCGEISGAFHMEEPAEHGLVELKHQPGPGNDFDIKVKGTLALEAAFEHRPLDFLVLFSSVTSIAPGSGQVSECAANAFLDAFAQAKYMWSRRTHVMAVNWPAWRSGERQEGVPEGSAQPQSPLQQEREQYGITPQEGVEALRRILLLPMPQVVVSTQDFPAVVERLHSPTLADAPAALERLNSSASAPGLTALDGDYVPPRSTVEKILADVWQELFGIQRIGIHDDFLRLGGHSLLAVQLITRVRQAFSIELPLTSLFTAPTIAGLAEQITAQQLTPEELEEIEQIYGEIDNLSTGEVQRQLAEELRRGEGRSTHEPIL